MAQPDGELVYADKSLRRSPYYFGKINWVGNNKYSNKELTNLLGIEQGDIYDNTVLQTRLLGSPDSRDVHSMYLDNGYYFLKLRQ